MTTAEERLARAQKRAAIEEADWELVCHFKIGGGGAIFEYKAVADARLRFIKHRGTRKFVFLDSSAEAVPAAPDSGILTVAVEFPTLDEAVAAIVRHDAGLAAAREAPLP